MIFPITKQFFKRKVTVVKKIEIGTHIESNKKIVYLTFDDGPSQNTDRILKILKKYNAKATFFVTGCHQEYNQYIIEAYKQGHTIGLHSYLHEYQDIYSSKDAYFKDLKKINKWLSNLLVFKSTIFVFQEEVLIVFLKTIVMVSCLN